LSSDCFAINTQRKVATYFLLTQRNFVVLGGHMSTCKCRAVIKNRCRK